MRFWNKKIKYFSSDKYIILIYRETLHVGITICNPYVYLLGNGVKKRCFKIRHSSYSGRGSIIRFGLISNKRKITTKNIIFGCSSDFLRIRQIPPNRVIFSTTTWEGEWVYLENHTTAKTSFFTHKKIEMTGTKKLKWVSNGQLGPAE